MFTSGYANTENVFYCLFGNRTSSDSVYNHSLDRQFRLPLRGHPVLLITRMITDRIRLHSVLLPYKSIENAVYCLNGYCHSNLAVFYFINGWKMKLGACFKSNTIPCKSERECQINFLRESYHINISGIFGIHRG